ncbi:M15 family metallopeptidase [Pseudokineococcus sp. 1T1Z-3]|uniref:M15 family metallopeptidase n=1 Tax=Pseudokineococcus sp. 1T1Z-3 TaxID=3132745 RepID=UPI00309E8F6F
MEGISSITSRVAGLQAQVASLSPGGSAAALAPSATTASSAAFSDVLAQQLAGASASGGNALGALAGAATGTGAAGAPAYTTTTTTSLSEAGLAQLLASLTGTPAGAAMKGAAGVPAVDKASAAAPVVGSAKVDASGVPVELKPYGNGKIPLDRLAPIGGAGSGDRLWAPAAAAFDQMQAAARADGVTFSVNDSYRSYDEQVSMAARKGLRSQGGLAATPGTSGHGWGLAVDLQLDGRAQAWMRENAGQHGFKATVSGEPWHWSFRPQSV